MAENDLPMMHGWLNEPGVVRWWEGEDVSKESVWRKYAPGADPGTEHWIAMVGSEPVGWIQCWSAESYPTETAPWFAHGIDRRAAGIDYLVASPVHRGQGLGTAMIDVFVTNIVFAVGRIWTEACASPFAANVASVRALEKAGFEWVADIRYPVAHGQVDDGPCALMVRRRALAATDEEVRAVTL